MLRRQLSRPLTMPSATLRSGGRRVRLLAALAARNEREQLPAWMRNVGPQVDGIVALDDGSTDGTAEWLAEREEVVELIRVPPDRPIWDEVANHHRLVEAAYRHGAEWLVCVDADERLERQFRPRAEAVIRRGSPLGFDAYHLRLRDLWDSREHYRVDGIWGSKRVGRLFRVREDPPLDDRVLHSVKVPLDARRAGRWLPLAAIELYHLGMLTAAQRSARREKYERLDPDHRWQSIGYRYLTDENGLRLRRIPARRGFED
jgi:hypothetical protein